MAELWVPAFTETPGQTWVIDGRTYRPGLVDSSGRQIISGREPATLSNTGVSVGTSTTQVLASNANRLYAAIVNDSDNEIYLALGASAVLSRGILLNPNGGSFEITSVNPFTGVINAICAVAAQVLTVVEGAV